MSLTFVLQRLSRPGSSRAVAVRPIGLSLPRSHPPVTSSQLRSRLVRDGAAHKNASPLLLIPRLGLSGTFLHNPRLIESP